MLAIDSNICGAMNCCWNAGSDRIFCTSALIFVTIVARRAAGGGEAEPGAGLVARHGLAKRSARSGNRRHVLGAAEASTLSFFSAAGCTTRLRLTDIRLMWPAMMSLSAGAAPR